MPEKDLCEAVIRRSLRCRKSRRRSGYLKEDIVFALDAIQVPVSLQEPVYSDGGDTLYVMDQVSDRKNKEENWVEESVAGSGDWTALDERERYIIELRFFEGKTQMEVAEYDLHFPGTGEPSGEMCPQKYAPVSELISGCFFIPFIL